MQRAENSYQIGDVVFERVRPGQLLIITGYGNNVYVCKIADQPKRKELVYAERELHGTGVNVLSGENAIQKNSESLR